MNLKNHICLFIYACYFLFLRQLRIQNQSNIFFFTNVKQHLSENIPTNPIKSCTFIFFVSSGSNFIA